MPELHEGLWRYVYFQVRDLKYGIEVLTKYHKISDQYL